MHLVDISSATGRDPVDDFDVITRELALFPGRDASGERLADKPRASWPRTRSTRSTIRSGSQRLREHLQSAGIPLYPVSAATGEGLDALLEAVWREVARDAGGSGATAVAESMTPRLNDFRHAYRYPGRHVRSRALRPHRHRASLRTARSRSIPCWSCRPARPPHRPAQPSASRVSPLRDGGARRQRRRRADGERSRDRRRRSRVTQSTRWRGCRGPGCPRRRSFSSPAPTRSPRSQPGAAIRGSSRWRISWSCRGRAIPGVARAHAGAGAGCAHVTPATRGLTLRPQNRGEFAFCSSTRPRRTSRPPRSGDG